MTYDVIVIGGGPSGLMAAIAAGERGAKTILIEKGEKLGKKLAISGGGRCNVTNRLPEEEIIRHIPGNGKFLYSAFAQFNNYDIIEFFESLGVALKEEDHGRMFPKSNSAKSVVQALINQLKHHNVEVKLQTAVKAIDYGEEIHTVILSNGDKLRTKTIIVAVGGKAVPQTGSNGDGYPWAKKAGHTVTKLYPTEVALVSNEPFIQDKSLQGLSLRDIALTVLNKRNKPIVTHQMDMLFTHFGVSGPAVLRCSQFVVKELMKGQEKVRLVLDTIPDKKENDLLQGWESIAKENPKMSVKNLMKGIAPKRYIEFILQRNNIDEEQKCAHLSKEMIRVIIENLKQFSFDVHGSLPLEKAFVTGGGISVKEIHPSTMQSKLMHGLYFCGEILDIHGYTGGYNITSALVTGRVAGTHAADEAGS